MEGENTKTAKLGPALKANLLARMAHRIWVESEPGQGATFYFTLRAAEDVG